MITLLVLFIITFALIAIGILVLSIGGTIFAIVGADFIIAAFVIWFIFFRKKSK